MEKKLFLILVFCFSCSSGLFKEKNNIPKVLEQKSVQLGEQTEAGRVESKTDSSKGIIPVFGPTEKQETSYEDKTEAYGLKDLQATNLYAIDFNHDGETDIVFLPEYYSTPVFYRFDSKTKKFIKLSYNPFPEILRTSFLTFVDIDHDGILDVLAATMFQKTEILQTPLRLFKGALSPTKEIHYEEKLDAFPKNSWGPSSLSFFDFDLDGKLDLYLGNWYNFNSQPNYPVPDNMLKGNLFDFKNDISGALKNENKKNRDSKLYMNARPTFGTSLCDIDQNGYPDILTVSSGGYANKLWINLADKTGAQYFEDFAEESAYAHDTDGASNLLGGGNGFFSLCTDYNNDGIMDIAYGAQFHNYDPESRDHSAILTGKTRDFPPRFIRTPYDLHFDDEEWSQSDRRGIWLDYNNDGLLDLLVENTGFPPFTRLVMFEQKKDHSFDDVSKKLGIDLMNPSGVVALDVNHDGQLDILVGQTNTRDARIKPRLYLFEKKKNKKDEGKSLRVHLIGDKSNFYAIGALVLLKTTEKVYRQMVQYSYGPLPSQNEMGLHFGLGKAKPVFFSVAWPSTVVDKKGNEGANIVDYKVSSLKMKGNQEITLCESGKWFIGRRQNCH